MFKSIISKSKKVLCLDNTKHLLLYARSLGWNKNEGDRKLRVYCNVKGYFEVINQCFSTAVAIRQINIAICLLMTQISRQFVAVICCFGNVQIS